MRYSAIAIFLFALTTLPFCLSVPIPATTHLLRPSKAEIATRSFTNGFGLLSAFDARAIYSASISASDYSNAVSAKSMGIEERQSCGAPFCSAGEGLNAPALPMLAMLIIAVGGLVMG